MYSVCPPVSHFPYAKPQKFSCPFLTCHVTLIMYNFRWRSKSKFLPSNILHSNKLKQAAAVGRQPEAPSLLPLANEIEQVWAGKSMNIQRCGLTILYNPTWHLPWHCTHNTTNSIWLTKNICSGIHNVLFLKNQKKMLQNQTCMPSAAIVVTNYISAIKQTINNVLTIIESHTLQTVSKSNPTLRHWLDMQLSTNPDNFVRIAHRTSPVVCLHSQILCIR